MTYTTNFIGSDGTDLGRILLSKSRFDTYYLNISNKFITPELWGWGQNYFGELGTNNTTSSRTPVTTFSGGSDWKHVSSGQGFCAAIKQDNTLWLWGYNFTGSLGIGDNTNRSTPIKISTATWRQVSCGFQSVASIQNNGTLWTWGNNLKGILGNNTNTNTNTPVTTFAGGNNWKQVSLSATHIAAIKTDGTLWIWGDNISGQLGTNDNVSRLTPTTTFLGGNNWKQVSCGDNITSAVKTDGTLWTWGVNTVGQLGTNNITSSNTPVTTFAGGNNWKQVSCGTYYMTAIKTDGTLWTWGDNFSGELGTNDNINRSTPITTFAGGNTWFKISSGYSYSSAIKTDGTLWVWGANGRGQLGINDINTRSTPVTTFIGGSNWRQVNSSIVSGITISIRSNEYY